MQFKRRLCTTSKQLKIWERMRTRWHRPCSLYVFVLIKWSRNGSWLKLTFTDVWAERCQSKEVVKNELPKNLFDLYNHWIVCPLNSPCSFLIFQTKIQTNVPCLFLIRKGQQSYWGKVTHPQIILHWRLNLSLPWKSHTSGRWGIIINKIRSHLQKEIWHFFLIFICPETKNVGKKLFKSYKIISLNGVFNAKALVWFCFHTSLIAEKSWKKKEKCKSKRGTFPQIHSCVKNIPA